MFALGRDQILDAARRVVQAEVATLQQITLGEEFINAIRILAGCEGRVLTTGIGKSGFVAQRIAATLTVAGTPAWFLHPAEAVHGDLGRVQNKDVLLAVSRGGETDEIMAVASCCARWGLPIVLITARAQSALGRIATVTLEHPREEACPLGLTPTSTATAASVLGDALALVLQQLHGFGPEEFAAYHPDGSLGRRLSLTVAEVMVTGDAIGTIAPAESLLTAMMRLARKRGTLAVCCDCKRTKLVGVITAGDIARYLESRGPGWEEEPVHTVMTEEAHTTVPGALASKALREMQEAGIMAMPVLDEIEITTVDSQHEETMQLLVGMVHLHDILRGGVA